MARPPLAAGIAAVVFGAVATGCSSSGPVFTVEGGLFAPTLKGDVGLAASQVTDVNTIDLSSQLDLGNREIVPYLRAELNGAGVDVALSGFRTKDSGTGTVSADFGKITAGSTVDSDLDLGLVHGRVAFDVVDTRYLVLGAGLGADYIDLQLKAQERVFNLTEAVDVKQAIPLLVARAVVRVPVLPVDFELEASGISGHYQDVDGTLLDVEALLHADVAGPLALFGGWRYVRFDIRGTASGQSFDGKVTLSGFLLGASLRF